VPSVENFRLVIICNVLNRFKFFIFTNRNYDDPKNDLSEIKALKSIVYGTVPALEITP
jgi:hypothetical protein